jgi:ATP-dependent Clp protease protease subunit
MDRVIYCSGDVDEEKASIINCGLLELQYADPLQDITLIVDSYGGELYSTFSIMDMMSLIQCDVRTVCIGKAFSAGAFLVINGARGKRLMTKNSSMMLHNPSAGVEGNVKDIELEVKEINLRKETLMGIVSNGSNLSFSEVKEMMDRNFYLDANDAISKGLVDGGLKSF